MSERSTVIKMQKISFVIPCYRSEKTIAEVVAEIAATVKDKNDFEIILVNDGSPDHTLNEIKRLSQNANVIGINMAKNFGQHAALMAGIKMSRGDIVVCLDDDGQTPADEVYKLINQINAGYDVVYAKYENKQHSGFRNLGSWLNGKMTEYLLDKPKDLYISSYFAMRRYIAEEIIKYRNPYPYVIGLVLRTTNNISCVEVKHRNRKEGASGYTLGKLLALWVNGFTAFSVKPLRIATLLGLLSAIMGFIYMIWVICNRIMNPLVPQGWSSTTAILLLVGGMILFVLGLIGEYIGRIYICINNSPQYVIRELFGREDGE